MKGGLSSTFPVDAVFVVCFSGYHKQRMHGLLQELERVGLKGKAQFVWTFPSPYEDWESSRLRGGLLLKKNRGMWGCTKGNYTAIKTAYELGCQTVLIMEDDVRFLKDLDFIRKAMLFTVRSWDILMLDHHHSSGGHGAGCVSNQYWVSRTKAYSTGAYILNRRAMARLIQLYEAPGVSDAPGVRCFPSDHYLDKWKLTWGYKLHVARTPLAVQTPLVSSRSTSRKLRKVFYKNTNFDKYAL